ncbi:MAG: methyltransferase [Candidatus Heimdallarchaeota archaeon]|nr:methyltransferase [Candidatus Heimdallarchaeota archaeon]
MKSLAFEIIGEILIIRESADDKILKDFAKEKMKKHTYIKTVVLQTAKVQGQERTRELRYILGSQNLETIHSEYGCQYLLNPLDTFFSPRLSFERQRIACLVNEDEVILNFFAGVGPFSIAIARKQPKCFINSIEINQKSCRYMKKNVELNKCEDIIAIYCGDAFEIIPQKFLNSIDRVLLPLPMESERSLPLAIKCLKGGEGTIHWQITEHLDSKDIELTMVEKRICKSLSKESLESKLKIEEYRVIRWIAPRIAHIAIDLKLFK